MSRKHPAHHSPAHGAAATAVEEQAPEDRKTLEALMAYAPEGIVIVDAPELRIRCSSRRIARLIGDDNFANKGDLVTEHYSRGFGLCSIDGHGMEDPLRVPVMRAIASGEVIAGEEWLFLRADGSALTILTEAGPIRDEAGEITGAVVVWRDITRQKKAEQELLQLLNENRVQRDFLQTLTEKIPIGIAVIRCSDCMVEFANPAFRTIPGTPHVPMAGRRIQEIYPDDTARDVCKQLYEARNSGKIVLDRHTKAFRKCEDERSVWNFHYVPLTGRSGRIDSVLVLAEDITGEIEAQVALEESERRFRNAVDNFPGVFALYYPDGRLRFMNGTGCTILGRCEQDIVGKSTEELFPPQVAAKLSAERQKVIDTKQAARSILKFAWIDNQDHTVSLNNIPLMDDRGNLREILTTTTDISEISRAKEQIENLNRNLEVRAEELDAANTELESFAYSVSHDLRAPLRAMTGFAKVLMEDYRDRLDEQGRGLLDRIDRAGERMERLIEDLLSLSQVIRMPLQRVDVDLSELARETILELDLLEPDRRVEWVVAENLHDQADPGLVKIALENLLRNAWKFTRHQEAAVIEFGRDQVEDTLVYFVRDNGVGFDQSREEKLFRPFGRLHSDREFPGTGVGLAIVKRIIDRHGGTIRARSREGEGATFYFSLDSQPPES